MASVGDARVPDAEQGDASWTGRPLERLEDERFLTGRANYLAAHEEAGMLHVVFVRSPFAHARIERIDSSVAASMPGVRAVFTAGDFADLRPLPIMRLPLAHYVEVGVPVLAASTARFAGEAVAAVVATSLPEAADAAELVEVDYEPLDPVTDPYTADAAPPIHLEAPDNVLLRASRRGGDIDAAFQRAAHVVEGRFELPRLIAAPMEPRGAVATYDTAEDRLTVYLSSQDPHRPLSNLADVLRRPIDSIRVVVPDVGGSFGSKGSLAPEAAAVAAMSMRLHAPVSWIETRSENFLAAPQGRGQSLDASLAIDSEGRFLGLKVRITSDLGAYLRPDTMTPPMLASSLVAGVYDIPAVEVDVIGVATNKVPTGPYRGAGRPEGAFVSERLADLAAEVAGLDVTEIRRRNFVKPEAFPYTTAVGDVLDAADFPGLLARVLELADYDATRARHRQERAAGRLPGLGLAVFLEPTGRGLWETASVEVCPDGSVVAHLGSCSHGQGHETTFAQVLADALSLRPEEVTIDFGDSSVVDPGMGTYASRSAMLSGSALLVAAADLVDRLRTAAAHHLEVATSEVEWRGGGALSSDGRSMDLKEIALAVLARPERWEPQWPLVAHARFDLPVPLFASGAFAVEIEIDPETGIIKVDRIAAVHDGGRILNPTIAEGQIMGGAVQGLGEALTEMATYDPDGQLTSGSFLSYGVLSAVEIPEFSSEFAIPASVTGTPIGAKGIGESGATGVPAATANAIADALRDIGAPVLQMPFDPERIWRVLCDARTTGSGQQSLSGHQIGE